MSDVVRFDDKDGYTVAVVLTPQCSGEDGQAVKTALDGWLATHASPRLALDLTAVQTLDSTLITWIIAATRVLEPEGLRVTAFGVGPQAYEELRVMIEQRFLWVYDNERRAAKGIDAF
jgi:anti-anti-sigma regulatory factor